MAETTDNNTTQGTAAAIVQPAVKRTPLLGGDKHIWGIYIALCLISIVELYSASSREVAGYSAVYGPIIRHFSQLVLGFCLVVVVQRIHYGKLAYAIPTFAVISVLMMLWVMVFGESVNGAARSLNLGFIALQPAEFIKISAVLTIALVLSLTQGADKAVRKRGMWITIGIIVLFAALLIKDGLTNTLILMAISTAMLLIGGIRIKHFAIVILVYAAIAGAGYGGLKYMSDHNIGRASTWFSRVNDFNDETPAYERAITADNQQEMYSYMAQANGGVFGVFPGNSREASRLPLAFSDFIYSIIIEDLGLVGGIVVLVLFLWLLARASGIAARCHNVYGMLLVIGMAVFIVTQAITHMAITSGIGPVTGQPLPLISKGGTSILITSIAFGIMLSVSRFGVAKNGKKREMKEDLNNIPENMRGENPSQITTL